jgi:hypothetical protein
VDILSQKLLYGADSSIASPQQDPLTANMFGGVGTDGMVGAFSPTTPAGTGAGLLSHADNAGSVAEDQPPVLDRSADEQAQQVMDEIILLAQSRLEAATELMEEIVLAAEHRVLQHEYQRFKLAMEEAQATDQAEMSLFQGPDTSLVDAYSSIDTGRVELLYEADLQAAEDVSFLQVKSIQHLWWYSSFAIACNTLH